MGDSSRGGLPKMESRVHFKSMKLQTSTIMDALLAYEKEHLGHPATTLQGEPFLSSELQFLQVYLSSSYHDKIPLATAANTLDDLPLDVWHHFPLFLYESVHAGNTGRIVARALSFLKWLGAQGEVEIPLNLHRQSLKSGEKEIKRLQQIHKHLALLLNNKVYHPGPTDQPEDLAWLDELHLMTRPVAVSNHTDIYKVVTKNRKQGYAGLTGEASGAAIAFKADPLLLRLLQPGDRMSLTLGCNPEGSHFLKDYDRPLVNLNFHCDE